MNSKQELLNNVSQRLYSLLHNNNEEEIKNLIYNNNNLKNLNPNFNMQEFKNIVLKNIGSLEKNSIKNYVNEEIFLNQNQNIKNISKRHYSSTNETINTNKVNKIIINEKDNFFNQNKNFEKVKSSPNLNLDNDKIRKLFKTYDVKNNNMINSNDVYFALIETAQQYPNLLEVPSYGLVTGIVKSNYGSKSEISYDDFLVILKDIKNNSN